MSPVVGLGWKMTHLPRPHGLPFYEIPWGTLFLNVNEIVYSASRFPWQFCFIAILQIHSGLSAISPTYYFLQGTTLQHICNHFLSQDMWFYVCASMYKAEGALIYVLQITSICLVPWETFPLGKNVDQCVESPDSFSVSEWILCFW